MLRREGAAVHLVGEQHLRPGRLSYREAPFEVLADACLHAPVQTLERDLHGVRTDAGPFQQLREWGPTPLRGPDGLVDPRLAPWSRCQESPPVAGAFHR